MSRSFENLVRRVSPAVVEVLVTGYGAADEEEQQASSSGVGRERSLGSGVIVDPDGYIIEVGQTTDPRGDWWPADWPPIGGRSS